MHAEACGLAFHRLRRLRGGFGRLVIMKRAASERSGGWRACELTEMLGGIPIVTYPGHDYLVNKTHCRRIKPGFGNVIYVTQNPLSNVLNNLAGQFIHGSTIASCKFTRKN
jgi:hypothetical protein